MISLEVWIGAAMLVSLVIYGLSGGADFGAGVWDLLATGPRRERQRALISSAIAPIWEAHHVWLIVVVVLLFVAFPMAFSTVSTALHIPLALMLVGIVLRGSAFVFRAYGIQGNTAHRRWGVVFAVSSTVTPVMLGVTLGAVSSGMIRVDPTSGVVETDFISAWLAPFPFAAGFLVLSLFAFLASVYLVLETDDVDLREDFRMRALISGTVVFVMAWVSFWLAGDGAPVVRDGLWGRLWSIPFQGITGMMATGALSALFVRWYGAARILAMVQVGLVVLGWGMAMFPLVVAPDLTLNNAAAPDSVLRPVLIALAVGGVVLIPSFGYLYAIFKGQKAEARADDGVVGMVEVDEE